MTRVHVAASVALLVAGFFVGGFLVDPTPIRVPDRSAELPGLESEVRSSEEKPSGESVQAENPIAVARNLDVTFRGRVTGPAGEPVAGIEIFAACATTPPGGLALQEVHDASIPFETLVESAIRTFRHQRSRSHEVVTDSGGRFEFTADASDRFELHAVDRDWILARKSGDGRLALSVRLAPEDESPIEILAGRAGRADIEIPGEERVILHFRPFREQKVDPTASRLSDDSPLPSVTHEWTPEDSVVHLLPGSYSLEVPGGQGMSLESVTVEVREDEVVPLVLDVTPTYQVVVVGRRFGVPSRVQQVVLLEGAHSIGTPERLYELQRELHSADRRGAWSVMATHDDRYEFSRIPRGPYTYALVHRSGSSNAIESGTVTVDRDLEIAIDLPTVPPSRQLRVNVTGPDGQPAEAELSIDWGARGPSGNFGVEVVSVGPGSYVVFRTVEDSTLQRFEGAPILVATNEVFGTATSEVQFGSTATIQFDEPSSLVIDLVGIESSRFASLFHLDVRPVGSGKTGVTADRESLPTSAFVALPSPVALEPTETIAPVAPGEVECVLTLKREGSNSLRAVARRSVRVVSGENRVELPVPPLFHVEIRRESWFSNGSLTPVEELGWPREDRSPISLDPVNGGVNVVGVAAGRYRLSIPGRPRISTDLDIEWDLVLDLRAAVPDAWEVHRRRGSESDSETGSLDVGDYVLSIDGVGVESEIQASALLGQLVRDGQARLRVRRHGREFDITVPVAEIVGFEATYRLGVVATEGMVK